MSLENIIMVIENCESELSEWLMLEYENSAQIWKNIIFTGVRNNKAEKRLSKIGRVEEKSFNELYSSKDTIILDPLGKMELKTEDFNHAKAIVVGGILGYSTPLGRTRKLISAKMRDAKIRNLGKKQLTIDTAVLVAKLIYGGVKLADIEITSEVEIKHNEHEATILPYGYVVINKKIMITPGLIDYLSSQ